MNAWVELAAAATVALCLGMVALGVNGHARWASECAALFFALMAAFFSPNPRLVAYPFAACVLLALLGERLAGGRGLRAAFAFAPPVLALLVVAAFCARHHRETWANWPLLGLLPVCVLARLLARRNRLLPAFLLFSAGALTLVYISWDIRKYETLREKVRLLRAADEAAQTPLAKPTTNP